LKIGCYISSHGFGHATRIFAVLNELLKHDIEIVIRANLPDWLINNSFKTNKVKYIPNFETIRIFHHPEKLTLNKSESIAFIQKYYSRYNKILENEIKFIKKSNCDLIISDIEPLAFKIADECGIHSIGISNFTWYDIYSEFMEKNDPILDRMKTDYTKATLLFRLPFHFKMDYFSEKIDVPLVFRKLTRTKNQIYKLLNINPDKNIVFIQFGGHQSNFIENWYEKINELCLNRQDIVFLTNRFLKLKENMNLPGLFKEIPKYDVETQDYIACSIVVGKTGYSTVSETIGYKSVFLYTTREKFKEDLFLKKGVENYGIGRYYDRNQFYNGIWVDDLINIEKLLELKPKKEIKKYGQKFITNYIIENF